MLTRDLRFPLTLVLLVTGCTRVTYEPNNRHCNNNEGDRYCAELFPDRPFCIQGQGDCANGDWYGCVAEVTPECHAQCGVLSEFECFGGSGTETGIQTGTTMDPTADDTADGTTGPAPCIDDEDCPDATAPFCEPESGECIGCDATADPEAACAELNPGMPLCVEGACVACTPENTIVCDDQMLLCDGDTNACVPCTGHDQCSSGACEMATGQCFPDGVVVTVDGDGGADYTSIAAAVADVADGAHGIIVVHEQNGSTPYTTAGGLIIGSGKSIALLAAPGEAPIIQGTGINPGVRVEGTDSILYMDGLVVSNGAVEGIVIDEAFAWMDRSRIVGNDGGGVLAQNAAEVTIRNCFVGGNVADVDAVAVDSSALTMLYTTVGAGGALVTESRGVFCAGGSMADIRNSIVLSADDVPELQCSGATVSNTATESTVGFDATWFNGYAAGNFSLSASGEMTFNEVARWQPGDPAIDIDGDPRPTTIDAPDFAGADVP